MSIQASRFRLAARAVLVASGALLLAACGASSSSSAAGTSPGGSTSSPAQSQASLITTLPDVCTLVTATDATTAAGTAMQSATSGVSIPGACIYSATDTTNSASLFIYAIAEPDINTASALKPDALAGILGGRYGGITNGKSVSGIGDSAFEYTLSGSGGGIAIWVVKANVVLFIVLSPSTDSNAIETLARAAVGHLSG